jgi:sRNA-binding carbon storage regulator CsrA
MLFLTRREGEAVRFTTPGGEEIWVRVTRGGVNVKLGIDAPPSVHVVREELLASTNDSPGLRKHMDRLAARKAG